MGSESQGQVGSEDETERRTDLPDDERVEKTVVIRGSGAY